MATIESARAWKIAALSGFSTERKPIWSIAVTAPFETKARPVPDDQKAPSLPTTMSLASP